MSKCHPIIRNILFIEIKVRRLKCPVSLVQNRQANSLKSMLSVASLPEHTISNFEQSTSNSFNFFNPFMICELRCLDGPGFRAAERFKSCLQNKIRSELRSNVSQHDAELIEINLSAPSRDRAVLFPHFEHLRGADFVS